MIVQVSTRLAGGKACAAEWWKGQVLAEVVAWNCLPLCPWLARPTELVVI
jgi:hypothetical protein